MVWVIKMGCLRRYAILAADITEWGCGVLAKDIYLFILIRYINIRKTETNESLEFCYHLIKTYILKLAVYYFYF